MTKEKALKALNDAALALREKRMELRIIEKDYMRIVNEYQAAQRAYEAAGGIAPRGRV